MNLDAFTVLVGVGAAAFLLGLLSLVVWIIYGFTRAIFTKKGRQEAREMSAANSAYYERLKCPACRSKISIDATRCPYCTTMIDR
jgi:hypothetical protein